MDVEVEEEEVEVEEVEDVVEGEVEEEEVEVEDVVGWRGRREEGRGGGEGRRRLWRR